VRGGGVVVTGRGLVILESRRRMDSSPGILSEVVVGVDTEREVLGGFEATIERGVERN
jgi:hypothetical protein